MLEPALHNVDLELEILEEEICIYSNIRRLRHLKEILNKICKMFMSRVGDSL